MSVRACSLILSTPQKILPGGYYVVRFPYAGESYDPWAMHDPAQPGGAVVTDWASDDRSGLIWPTSTGWGTLTANIHWEAGDYSEVRDRFVRDPLGSTPDSTATDHRPPSPGMQCITKQHEMVVHDGVPIALLVSHNDSVPRKITHAQFKLSIQPLETPPGG